jgi:phage head maturation protease
MSDNPILYPDVVGAGNLRADTSGRTVYGIVVPFNQRAEIEDFSGSYTEMFIRGSFSRSIEQRGSKIKLFGEHDRRRFPVGRATSLVDLREVSLVGMPAYTGAQIAGVRSEFFIPRAVAERRLRLINLY